jgi:hypothetical protein
MSKVLVLIDKSQSEIKVPLTAFCGNYGLGRYLYS